MDDRLGPHPRIRRRVDDRRGRLERLLPADPRRLRHAPAGVDVGRTRRRRRGRHRQPAGDHHRARHLVPAGHRRARERALQRGHGRGQARGHSLLHRRRRRLREARELVAVHALRLGGHHGGGGGRLLCLHRIRRRLDDGRRGEESQPRPADRHHRLAHHLHGVVPVGRGHPERHHPGRRRTRPMPRS